LGAGTPRDRAQAFLNDRTEHACGKARGCRVVGIAASFAERYLSTALFAGL